MTSAFSPAADRAAAARFLLLVLDDSVADAVAMLSGPDTDQLVAGLALGMADLLIRQHGGVSGAREVLELELLDPDILGCGGRDSKTLPAPGGGGGRAGAAGRFRPSGPH